MDPGLVNVHAYRKSLIDYIKNSQSNDLTVQIDAVRKLIPKFSNQINVKVDRLFIKHFPKKLYEEFHSIIEKGINVDGYQEKKMLFVDVITFIFRNLSLVMDNQAQPFFELFLKCIKTDNSISICNPSSLFYAVHNCLLNEHNTILFINENGMYHFYNNFIDSNASLSHRFWEMCEFIYKLDRMKSSSLCRSKLTENVNQITYKFWSTGKEDYTRQFVIVFRMLHRLRLLDEFDFNVNHFYEIAVSIFIRWLSRNHASLTIVHLSKLWSAILNGSHNSFQIYNLEKLIFFAAIFSIDLSSKLRKLIRVSGVLKVTKNKKQRLYIIYFTLVAFPMINHDANPWLCHVLKELHNSLPFANQFLIIQYYIKSQVTLNMEISSHDREVFNGFFRRLVTYRSLKLHSSFISSLLFLELPDRSTFKGSGWESGIAKIRNFLYNLIWALSDDIYIHKLENEKKLFMYEDLKSQDLTIMNEDFMKSVFSGCRTHLQNDIQSQNLETRSENGEFEYHAHVLEWVVLSFNNSNCLNMNSLYNYMRFSNEYYAKTFKIQNDPNISDGDSVSNESKHTYISRKPQFEALLRWFVLIFELKFIFGDINSKFGNLNISDML
ncbi:hypothetical protein RF11_15598 [Thelohanellus kitauei]|uniref:Uncharacterized protein n=1 Tax=Thelohanellus kitauei TaxID=669202 RepID=A0A0C2NIP1_THEKT|nr:hypothetical protein RF11_15598 [Thelohanellus kitauei]